MNQLIPNAVCICTEITANAGNKLYNFSAEIQSGRSFSASYFNAMTGWKSHTEKQQTRTARLNNNCCSVFAPQLMRHVKSVREEHELNNRVFADNATASSWAQNIASDCQGGLTSLVIVADPARFWLNW